MKIRNIFNSNRDGVRYTKEMQQRLIQIGLELLDFRTTKRVASILNL